MSPRRRSKEARPQTDETGAARPARSRPGPARPRPLSLGGARLLMLRRAHLERERGQLRSDGCTGQAQVAPPRARGVTRQAQVAPPGARWSDSTGAGRPSTRARSHSTGASRPSTRARSDSTGASRLSAASLSPNGGCPSANLPGLGSSEATSDSISRIARRALGAAAPSFQRPSPAAAGTDSRRARGAASRALRPLGWRTPDREATTGRAAGIWRDGRCGRPSTPGPRRARRAFARPVDPLKVGVLILPGPLDSPPRGVTGAVMAFGARHVVSSDPYLIARIPCAL